MIIRLLRKYTVSKVFQIHMLSCMGFYCLDLTLFEIPLRVSPVFPVNKRKAIYMETGPVLLTLEGATWMMGM